MSNPEHSNSYFSQSTFKLEEQDLDVYRQEQQSEKYIRNNHISVRVWHDQLIGQIGPLRPPVSPNKTVREV